LLERNNDLHRPFERPLTTQIGSEYEQNGRAGGQEPSEGDFTISNENPQTGSVPRDPQGTVYWRDGGGDLIPQPIAMLDWPVIGGTAYQDCPGHDCAAWLHVNGGVVTELVEQYLP